MSKSCCECACKKSCSIKKKKDTGVLTFSTGTSAPVLPTTPTVLFVGAANSSTTFNAANPVPSPYAGCIRSLQVFINPEAKSTVTAGTTVSATLYVNGAATSLTTGSTALQVQPTVTQLSACGGVEVNAGDLLAVGVTTLTGSTTGAFDVTATATVIRDC